MKRPTSAINADVERSEKTASVKNVPITMKGRMKSRIHVNQHNVRHNKKHGTDLPPITVKSYKQNIKCSEVAFTCGRVVYQPDKPLSCGATLWIETDQPVTILR